MPASDSRRPRSSGALVSYLVAILLVLGVAMPEAALADDPAPDPAAASGSASQSNPDFLFGPPSGSFGIRGGWTFNRSEGEIYDFITDTLTVEDSDFDAPMAILEFSWRLNDRLDAVIGLEYSRSTTESEFRDFVGSDDLPILQETELTQVPLTLSLRWYLTSRGRQVGRYAWVPSSIAPYIGGGGGFTYYRLEQAGEFVDFTDLAIFADVFTSDGWGVAAHAFGGVDIKLTPSLSLLLEGRYQWAEADLGDDFVGFDPIDLNGLRATAGVAWRF